MKVGQVNVLLLAAAASLFALLVVDERQERARIASAIQPRPPLTTLDANAIRGIRLHNIGSPDVLLEKTGSGWHLREPVAMPADLVQVGNLTALATMETRGAIDTAVAKLANLGLDPPRSTVSFDGVTLAIGELEPIKRSRYIGVNPGAADHLVRLVDDFALEAFDGEYTDLINKALLPFDATIIAFELPGLRLHRDAASGDWHATPPTPQATPATVQALVDAWRETRALATLPALVEPDPDTRPGVSVTLADGRTFGFLLVDRGESWFLQRTDVPVSYQLAAAEADRLARLLPLPRVP